MRLARRRGATVLAVTNVMNSQATRDADAVLFTRAGIEVSVAATKTFTSQVAAFAALALGLAQARGILDAARIAELAEELERLPEAIQRTVEQCDADAERLACAFRDAPVWLFLGRHVGAPIAMEGALKLKEVTYRPAEAYAAGELKHGPIALIAPGTPVVCVATESPVREKVLSNIAEVHARGAEVIAIAGDGDRAAIDSGAAEVLHVPTLAEPMLQAVLAVVPMQMLAHRLAQQLDLNVDQPRNLAKTVTVE
jgi:glucosamine--fructose-6-phosphate aminotransferase (isomerizing)